MISLNSAFEGSGMKELLYFPGCTLKTTAKNFEDSMYAVARVLGVRVVELERWNCCGTVYSLATDNLMYHVASVRNLIRAQEMGRTPLMTLCSMCYNTLKRANMMVREERDKLVKLNAFMDEEEEYEGGVEVVHLLEVLRGIDAGEVREHVKEKLNLRVLPYYGCLLVRPRKVGIDDPDNPMVMDRLLSLLGAEPVDSPFKTVCCGSYLTVDKADYVSEMARRIVTDAIDRGAEAVCLSCPLCFFNLDRRQVEAAEKFMDFKPLPIFYFTQLMALAFGVNPGKLGFNLHNVDPLPLLREKGLV